MRYLSCKYAFLETGASKFVVLSSKTVISRGTCVKKLNLLKRFSEPFFDGACLCGVNVIIAPVFLIQKKDTPSMCFFNFDGENTAQ